MKETGGWEAGVKEAGTGKLSVKAEHAASGSVDLILESPRGVLGLEIKNREKVDRSDTGPLRALAASLGPEWLGGLVVHRGARIERISPEGNIWGVPVHRLV